MPRRLESISATGTGCCDGTGWSQVAVDRWESAGRATLAARRKKTRIEIELARTPAISVHTT